MTGLRYTLLGDGTADRVLDRPIRWALKIMGVPVELSQWADLTHVRPRPASLNERARRALEYYPADLLFLHRDAEGATRKARQEEIEAAVGGASRALVPIVPVRMTEAWLLHDVAAIRGASGNPNGTAPLSLPPAARVESEVDPKVTLRTALLDASELTGRRRRQREREFGRMRERTAELISDFSPLRAVPAFGSFLRSLESALRRTGHLGKAP